MRSAWVALASHEPVALNEETAALAAQAEVVAGHSHIVASAAGHVGRHRVLSGMYLRAAHFHALPLPHPGGSPLAHGGNSQPALRMFCALTGTHEGL